MPIIKVQQSDLLTTLMVEPGAYAAEITQWKSDPSKSGKGINHWIDFTITAAGKYTGKVISVCVSTATSSDSLLGNRQFLTVGWVSLIQAAINKTTAAPGDVDSDTLMRKPLDIVVGVEPVSENGAATGKLANTLTGVHPVGTGKGKVPF